MALRVFIKELLTIDDELYRAWRTVITPTCGWCWSIWRAQFFLELVQHFAQFWTWRDFHPLEKTKWIVHLFLLFHIYSYISMSAKQISRLSKIYYSPQGYWKGVAAIEKLPQAAKGLWWSSSKLVDKASSLAGLLACTTAHSEQSPPSRSPVSPPWSPTALP